MEVFEAAVSLIAKSVVLSAQWAGQRRRLCLRQAAAGVGELAQLRAELTALRDENHRLKSENGSVRSRLRAARSRKPHYTVGGGGGESRRGVPPRLHTYDCTLNPGHPPIRGVTAPLHCCLPAGETRCRPFARRKSTQPGGPTRLPLRLDMRTASQCNLTTTVSSAWSYPRPTPAQAGRLDAMLLAHDGTGARVPGAAPVPRRDDALEVLQLPDRLQPLVY